jgi:hypothetical protein
LKEELLEKNNYFKNVRYFWHKNKYEDQGNKIEGPDINPHSYAHLNFDKDAKGV